VEFRILGPLEVVEDGRSLPLGRGKERALLALLLLRANEVVSADTLIDELWPEGAPATATKSLQVYVSRLRKRLGSEVLVTRSPGYMLAVRPAKIDAVRFEGLVDDARASTPIDASSKLRDALSLWRGSPLANVEYEPFAQPEIARLEELHVVAFEERIEADLALGRHSELAGELEGLVARYPLRERLRAQLMLALYRSGRQVEALETYREARRILTDELGLEPSGELKDLERRILAQDPALAAPPRERVRDARPNRRREKYLVAALLSLAGLATIASVALTRGQDPSPVVAVPNSVAVIDPEANRVVQAIPVGERPAEIAISGDDVWVLHPDRSTISHISRGSGEVTGTVGIGGAPSDLVAEPRGAWVSDARTGAVTLIERERLVPARIIPTRRRALRGRSDAGHLAVGFGSLWVASGDDVITRIDLRTGRVAGRIRGVDTGQSEGDIASGAGSIWVAGPFQTSPVTRIDPRRNAVAVRIPLQKYRANGIAFGDGGVWVSDVGGDQVWRIDAARNTPSGSTKVGLGPLGVAAGAGSIWVANSGDGTVSRIDPVTARVVQTIDVGGSPNRIAVAGDEVWVTVG
jgi:YVTN family beta-propeller protein